MKRISLALTLLLIGICAWGQSQTYLIDFGPDDLTNGNPTVSPDGNGNHWNNLIAEAANGSQLTLVDVTNQSSTAYLEVIQPFLKNGIQNGGLLSPSAALLGEFAIATATQDYFFTTGTSELVIGGLTPGNGFVFTLFGTRQTTIVRETQYLFTGATTYQGTLQTSGPGIGDGGYDGNNDTVLETDTIYADPNGEISLELSVAQGGFAYLGLMKMVDLGAGAPSNLPPVADAGEDRSFPAGTVADSLLGSGSDPDGDNLTYAWTQLSGPGVTIDDNTAARTAISGLTDNTQYQFELSVSDGDLSDADTVTLTVRREQVSTTLRSFLVDFGPNDVTNGNITLSPDANGYFWNNLVDPTSGANTVSLKTLGALAADAEISIVSPLISNGIQNGGLLAPEDSLLGELAIATATQDYFYTVNSGEIAIKDLNPGRGYVFTLFGSRNTASVRKTEYELNGATTYVDTLQTSGQDIGGVGYNGNNRDVVVTPVLRPDAAGVIRLKITVVEGGFAYLNMMRIDEVPDNPEFLVDFGPNDGSNGNLTPSPDGNGNFWNNLIDPTDGGDTLALANAKNEPTGAYLKVQAPFNANGINHGGLLNPDENLLGELAVATATQDYFFLAGSNVGTLEFGGLDTASGYIFNLFGTRNTTTTRITEYAFNGAASYVDSLQTSGADLGGIGYNGNNSAILVTDTLYPNAQGTITLDIAVAEGGFAYLGMLKMEQIIPVVETEPEQLIAVMGSSVADGFGATNSQGYAYVYTELLEQRYNDGLGAEYNVANISIGGNNTIALLNRWDSDLLPLNADYVIYGLSLGNEGIRSNGQSAFDQFRDNMLVLIERARSNGIEPVVVNCYARADFDATDYQFTKDMNELIHTWDVASINSLGAVDDRQGRWATGYEADPYHPNTAGHTEMSYSIVPSLFDALKAGKAQPERATDTYLTLDKSSANEQLEFTPDAIAHSFTSSFDIRTTGSGVISTYTTDDGGYGALRIYDFDGVVTYETSTGTNIAGSVVVNDGNWHEVTLTHYYALGRTYLYVDGMLQGELAETLEPDVFALSEANGPTADYRDWFFYRAGMNDQEVMAMANDSLLKSSLELYAPLDGQAVLGSDVLVNLATSTNFIAQVTAAEVVTSIHEPLDEGYFQVYPNPSQGQTYFTFRLERAAEVNLSLYDLQGREVASLVKGEMPVGEHEIRWEASQLPGQLYLCRLQVGDQQLTRSLWLTNP